MATVTTLDAEGAVVVAGPGGPSPARMDLHPGGTGRPRLPGPVA